MWGIEIAVMFCMIALNALFAAYEIALACVPLARLHTLVHDARRGAKAALAMKTSMEGSLAVVQLGTTLVGAIAAATGGAGAEQQIAPKLRAAFGVPAGLSEMLAIAIVVVPLTVATILFGELIPKVFALRNKEWVCLRMSPAMRWFAAAVWPAVWCLETAVKTLLRWAETRWQKRLEQDGKDEASELQELRASAAVARMSRLIGARQEQIILGAAAFSQRPVREIMLSAEFISMLDVESSLADALVAAHLDMHTRFPVTERPGEPQGIVGYVNFKDIVAQLRFSPDEPTLRPIVRGISTFAADMPVAKCLERLIREHSHIALIRDDADKVVGMVTMEDMIEELVGDIEDEYDRLPAHAVAAGKGWIVGGALGLEALRERTGIDLVSEPCGERGPRETASGSKTPTVSEWIASRLETPIRGGEVLELPTVRVAVRKCRRHKVMEAYVLRKEPRDEERKA